MVLVNCYGLRADAKLGTEADDTLSLVDQKRPRGDIELTDIGMDRVPPQPDIMVDGSLHELGAFKALLNELIVDFRLKTCSTHGEYLSNNVVKLLIRT